MAQNKRLRHRIAQRSDAELQRSTIRNGTRDVQASGVFGETDGFARRSEQWKVGLFCVEEIIEFACGQVSLARHERQFAVDLSNEEKRGFAAPALREQVKRNVGVATEAAARLAVTYALGDQLPDDIRAAIEHITQGVGVIGRNVVLLGRCLAKAASCQKEKLIDL